MKITNIKISQDRTSINLTIEDAATASSLKLWDDKTYKDFSLAIDLTTKLTGSILENITISLADLNIPFFDGIYFIEVESSTEISFAITSDLTRFKECILEKTLAAGICDDCSTKNIQSVLNAQGLLRSLQDSIENGFIDEILLINKSLNKYCSIDCKTCGNLKNQVNNNYYSYNQ